MFYVGNIGSEEQRSRRTIAPPNDIYIGGYTPDTLNLEVAGEFIHTAGRIIDKLVVCDEKGRPKTKNNVPYENISDVHVRRVTHGTKNDDGGRLAYDFEDDVRFNFTSPGTGAPYRKMIINSLRIGSSSGRRKPLTTKLTFYEMQRSPQPDAVFSAGHAGGKVGWHLWTPSDDPEGVTIPFLGKDAVRTFEEVEAQRPGVVGKIVDTLRMAETVSEDQALRKFEGSDTFLSMGVELSPSRHDPYDVSSPLVVELWRRFRAYHTIPARKF
ncbi:MAG TPA: hypothetical protein VF401_00990 [Candidatus Saccharimonadales bacterium]